MKKKSVILFLLFFTVGVSGFNFFPQFKVNNIPIFHALTILTILVAFLFSKKKKALKFKPILYYQYYIISIIPSLIAGIVYVGFNSTLIFIYALFPLLLFRFTYYRITKRNFENLLFVLSFSMLAIVVIGWLIRLLIIPINTFFDVQISQWAIGYWGISYLKSSRNNDYLYPLIGLAIAAFFYISKKRRSLNLILIIVFLVSLIASLSRGAIIISVITIGYLFNKAKKWEKFILVLVAFVLIIFTFNKIKKTYNDTYSTILSSLFTTNNHNSRFSNHDRLQIIEFGVESSLTRPFGVGIGNYQSIYSDNTSLRESFSGENAFLTILVENGWLALVFFGLMFLMMFKILIRSRKLMVSHFLLPSLFIYFLFNYELNNAFVCFMFFILFLDIHFIWQE